MSDYTDFTGEYWAEIDHAEFMRQHTVLEKIRKSQESALQLSGVALEVMMGGKFANMHSGHTPPNEGTSVYPFREKIGNLTRMFSYPLSKDVDRELGVDDIAVSLHRTDILWRDERTFGTMPMRHFAGCIIGDQYLPVSGVSVDALTIINGMCDHLADIREQEGLTMLEPFTMKERYTIIPV